jgi:hypothetical protein
MSNAEHTLPAVCLKQKLVAVIPQEMVKEVFLSIPRWRELNGRGGIVRDRTRGRGKKLPWYDLDSGAKLTYDDHIGQLGLAPEDPLLIIGARNLGNNLRIIAYMKNKGILQVEGEEAGKGERPYHCLCLMDSGKLEAHELLFKGDRISSIDGTGAGKRPGIRWALSGQPLLWGGEADTDTIIRATYDLRHFYRIPTGKGRFGSRSQEGDIAEEIITLLMDSDDAVKVRAYAAKLGLQPEKSYLHSAVGLSGSGDIIIVQEHGSFETVAETLRREGATHAIELDQGGSVSTHFVYKQDGQGAIGESRIFASHYFRDRASALLVFNLCRQKDDKPFVPVREEAPA